jgi:hypothetical protein
VAPCETCTACDGSDKNCFAVNGDFSLAGANFCTSCVQEGFFPEEFADIADKEDYFVQQKSIVANANNELDKVELDNGQKEKIKELYGEMTMVEFYATPVRIDGVE